MISLVGVRLYVLDENGGPVEIADVIAWSEWWVTAERALACDWVNGVRVSTVFLSIDHNFAGDGPPLLWETRVFGGALDGETKRYATADAALSGHARLLARVLMSEEVA